MKLLGLSPCNTVNENLKIIQHADGCTNLLKDTNSSINKCKKVQHISNLKMDEFLTELIWSDNLFNMTQIHIYFENWLKVVFFISKMFLMIMMTCMILNILLHYIEKEKQHNIS